MRVISRAAGVELVFQALEAAVEVIDAVDHGLAFRRQRGDHQRHRGAQVGRHHRRALELAAALDGGGLAVELDAGAEPRQLLHMHEAVLEDGLGDARGALGAGHQRHELRLQVGGKARERRGRHIDRRDAGAVARDPDAGIGGGDLGAGLREHVERRLQQFRAARPPAARRRRSWRPPSHRCRSRCGPAARCGARRASRGTPSTTMREVPAPLIRAPILLRQSATSPISGSRAAFSITRGAVGERRGHQRRMGAADRDLGKHDFAAAQAVRARAIT